MRLLIVVFAGLAVCAGQEARFEDSIRFKDLQRSGAALLWKSDPAFAYLLMQLPPSQGRRIDKSRREIVEPGQSRLSATPRMITWTCDALDLAMQVRISASRSRIESSCSNTARDSAGKVVTVQKMPILVEREGSETLVEALLDDKENQFHQSGTLWPRRLPAWAPDMEGLASKVIFTDLTVGPASSVGGVWFISSRTPKEVEELLRSQLIGKFDFEPGGTNILNVRDQTSGIANRLVVVAWAETEGGAFAYRMEFVTSRRKPLGAVVNAK